MADNVVVRKADFFEKYGISIQHGKTVTSIDYAKKDVILSDGSTVPYEKLLIASGAETIVPKIAGTDKITPLTLRTLSDLETIRNAMKDKVKDVTIIGAGFVGIELSSALKAEYKDAVNVTVVDVQDTPFSRVFGSDVGKSIQDLAEKNGIKFELKAHIKEIKSDHRKKVKSVELDTKSIPTDLVIFATGVRPVTNFAGGL